MLNHSAVELAPVDRVLQALADPTRRRMVEVLSDGPVSVSELARPFDMTLSAIVQHLAVLEASEVFLQDALHLPNELVLALPFLVILPVLALGAGRMQGARIPRFEP